MHNTCYGRVQYVQRLNGRILRDRPPDEVPTLFWSPELSLYCDGMGREKLLWSLSSRNDAAAYCRILNVRFVDRSDAPLTLF